MRKILAVVAALVLPAIASAAAGTWSIPDDTVRSSKFVCTQAGVTCDAPTAATDGALLSGSTGVVVTVCAASGQTLSGAGTLLAYVYNPIAGLWARVPDLDLTTTTASVRCLAFPGIFVAVPAGRIAYVPSSVTASSNNLTIYVNGAGPGGQL